MIGDYKGMQDGDGILCFNFRADRVREILAALLEPTSTASRASASSASPRAVGMTHYSDELAPFLGVLFAPHKHGQPARRGGRATPAERSCASAETEKYPHVTYFLNGGREAPFAGEDRIMVPSPKVATYDLQPEMSAPELTDKAVAAIDSGKYDLIVLNFANPDMVGHTGVLAAGDQGGGDGRCGTGPHRRGGGEAGRRAAGHRRSRQLRADERPRDRRSAHRAHHQSRCRCC